MPSNGLGNPRLPLFIWKRERNRWVRLGHESIGCTATPQLPRKRTVTKAQDNNRRPIPHDTIGERSERLRIEHLIQIDWFISEWVGAIVRKTIFTIRIAPIGGIVTTCVRIVLAGNPEIHVTYFLVRVHISGKADTGRWRSSRCVGHHPIRRDNTSGPTKCSLNNVGVCYGIQARNQNVFGKGTCVSHAIRSSSYSSQHIYI